MLNFRMIATTSVATLLLLVAATPASAGPLWDVDFEADTAGAAPATGAPTAGAVNTMPSNSFAGSPNTLLVQNGYSDTTTTASLSSNVAVLSDTGAGSTVLFFDGADADAASTGIYEIEFDMVRESTDGGNNTFLNIQNTAGANIAQLLFRPNGSDRVTVQQYTSPGVAGTVVNAFFADYDSALNIRYRFDFGAATQEVFLDDVLFVSGTLPGSGAVNLDSFEFATGGSTSGTWAIDNVTGVVPEPTSIVLVGLGLIGLIGFGRQRR